jgi:hypothetical protein
VEEIIEGCFKLFFGLLFVIGAPVVAAIYMLVALRWCLHRLHELWLTFWPALVGGGACLLCLVIGGAMVVHWWEQYQIKWQRQRALNKLGLLYEHTAKRMDELSQVASDGAP